MEHPFVSNLSRLHLSCNNDWKHKDGPEILGEWVVKQSYGGRSFSYGGGRALGAAAVGVRQGGSGDEN